MTNQGPALFEVALPEMLAFDPSRCHVTALGYGAVREVLASAHYIGTPGATSVALGLYVDNVLGGVMTFGTIPRNNAEAICGLQYAPNVMELTRLAVYDWAPANVESWFIGQALHRLREDHPRVKVLVSYADSSVGHVGTIYQATNWIYTGESTNDVVYRCDDGTLLHPRTTGRLAEKPAGRWVPSSAKHRYVTFVGAPSERRALRRALRWESLPYPKREDPCVIHAQHVI